MTIVRMIDSVVGWINENVCPNIEMKMPPKDRQPTNENYNYELVNPYCFPLYIPQKDKMPPEATSVFPSVCVQLEYGTDTVNNREISIILSFGGWNPGVHPGDWLIPGDDEPLDKDILSRLSEGWRDLWNFVDYTVNAIESAGYLGKDVEVMAHEPIEFGCYREQDSIPSYYPYWFAYCKLKIRSIILRNDQELLNLL